MIINGGSQILKNSEKRIINFTRSWTGTYFKYATIIIAMVATKCCVTFPANFSSLVHPTGYILEAWLISSPACVSSTLTFFLTIYQTSYLSNCLRWIYKTLVSKSCIGRPWSYYFLISICKSSFPRTIFSNLLRTLPVIFINVHNNHSMQDKKIIVKYVFCFRNVMSYLNLHLHNHIIILIISF